MEDKDLRLIEIEEGVFIVDTSGGPTPNGDALKAQVDKIFRDVNVFSVKHKRMRKMRLDGRRKMRVRNMKEGGTPVR